jgi:hypothetical protein
MNNFEKFGRALGGRGLDRMLRGGQRKYAPVFTRRRAMALIIKSGVFLHRFALFRGGEEGSISGAV